MRRVAGAGGPMRPFGRGWPLGR
ncbi:unnamed protein product [Linum tenue]|uniref:Uncharacterized protein n=1 Tax=Linum tenue TaxID=586396 RepID=A0AAV0LAH7_9ROSI|nr:unnamed protein product [Linum tenue]